MNNITKAFKNKAARSLRAFDAGGAISGLIDADTFNKRIGMEDDAIATKGERLRGLASSVNNMPGLSNRQRFRALSAIDADASASGLALNINPDTGGLSQREQLHGMLSQSNAAQARDDFGLRRSIGYLGQQANLLKSALPPTPGYAGGGEISDPVARAQAALAASQAKYGGATQPSAPAPAPAPAPTPAPTQERGIFNLLRNRDKQIDKAVSGFSHGGEPGVDAGGFIRGPGGVDNVPAQVADTGENILVSKGERIINKDQNKVLEAVVRHATGKPMDEFLETATGKPVGPQLKRGLRAHANAGEIDDLTSRARVSEAARSAPVSGYNTTPEAAQLRETLAKPNMGNTIRNDMARAVNAGGAPRPTPAAAPAPAPAAAPANLVEPMTFSEPAPAARTGIAGRLEQVKAAVGNAVNSARAAITPAPAPSDAYRIGMVAGEQAGAIRNAPSAVLTNGGGRVAAADFALRSGNHWDATAGWDDTAKGGIGPMDKGQIVARDAINAVGDVVGGAAGAGLGGLARVIGPLSGVAGKAVGGLAGAVTGGNLTDKGMDYARRGLNWANGQMGGDPNYWKDSDANIEKQNKFLQSQPGYEESAIQKGSKQVSSALDKTVVAALEKVGLITREHKPDETKVKADVAAEAKAKADAEAKAKAGAAAASKAEADKTNPLRDPTTNKIATEDNANIRTLRDAGVTGDLGGDKTVWKNDVVGKFNLGSGPGGNGAGFNQSTPNKGIRTIQTANGNVYAGRDKNGQLNVVSGLDRPFEENEAARAKEAARSTADLKRQSDYFDNLRLKSDMDSPDIGTRIGAAMRMGLRQQDLHRDIEQRKNDTQRYGYDVAREGHYLDAGAKRATLQNQMQQQNLERNNKLIDQLYPATIKGGDGKEVTNPAHQDFVESLSATLGQHGRHIGHLTPQDLVAFQTAYKAEKNGKPGALQSFYNKWIDGRPDVEDFDPFRQTGRAEGADGDSNALGYYRNANGSLRWEPGTVGQHFFSGRYNKNIKDQIDQR